MKKFAHHRKPGFFWKERAAEIENGDVRIGTNGEKFLRNHEPSACQELVTTTHVSTLTWLLRCFSLNSSYRDEITQATVVNSLNSTFDRSGLKGT